jgi:membrane-associated phospholipid phosphatase
MLRQRPRGGTGRLKNILIVTLAFISLAAPAKALPAGGADADPRAEAVELYAPGLFDNLGGNLYDSFISPLGLLHLAAVPSTWALSYYYADYHVQKYFSEHTRLENFYEPAAYLGYVLPLAVAGPLYAHGKIAGDNETLGAGCAAAQSALIAVTWTTVLKGLTGRPHPDGWYEGDARAYSREFNIGLARGSLHWGWPSGHTCVTMSMATALTAYYPGNPWVPAGGYAVTAYVMIGMLGEHRSSAHWLSDIVAGALMGVPIGWAVGKNFRRAVDGAGEGDARRVEVLPLIAPGFVGLAGARRW